MGPKVWLACYVGIFAMMGLVAFRHDLPGVVIICALFGARLSYGLFRPEAFASQLRTFANRLSPPPRGEGGRFLRRVA